MFFFDEWNAKLPLDSNGRKFFSEEPMGEAMLGQIDQTMKDLGMDGFTFA